MKRQNEKNGVEKCRGAGRQFTGKAPAFSTRLPPELVAMVDQYARARGISRSEAIRLLLERALGLDL